MFAFGVQTWSDDCNRSQIAMFRKDFDRNVLEYLATRRLTHSCKRANRLLQSLTPYKWLSHLSFSTKLMILIPSMNKVQSWLNIVIKIRLPITRLVQLFVLCDAFFYETTPIFEIFSNVTHSIKTCRWHPFQMITRLHGLSSFMLLACQFSLNRTSRPGWQDYLYLPQPHATFKYGLKLRTP